MATLTSQMQQGDEFLILQSDLKWYKDAGELKKYHHGAISYLF